MHGFWQNLICSLIFFCDLFFDFFFISMGLVLGDLIQLLGNGRVLLVSDDFRDLYDCF